MAKKKTEIVIPILNNTYKVVVTFTPTAEGLRKVLREVGFTDEKFIRSIDTGFFNDRLGATLIQDGCHPVITLPRAPKTYKEIGTLSHEASHAIEFICKRIGQPFGDEFAAHSIGAVVEETLKQIRKA
jgi:hypothetical protein